MSLAKIVVESVNMPPGEYWVGDPCYAVSDDRWIEWLTAAGIDENPIPRFMLAEIDGYSVLGVGTYGGDGTYFDQRRREYPVDAGMIGLVPVQLVKEEPFGMHNMDFPHGVIVSYKDGDIIIGGVIIDTR